MATRQDESYPMKAHRPTARREWERKMNSATANHEVGDRNIDLMLPV
jgi:hypothetical protein